MNSSGNKKTLLIFFGELRTFEQVIPQLKNLNKVDIVLSTWSKSRKSNNEFLVNESYINKILPNIKQLHIVDPNDISDFLKKHPTWKMYWHWKNAINNIINHEEYENVILHRCDMISDWYNLIDLEIENDTIYLETGDTNQISYIKEYSGIWVNDYCFFGKFDIMKKFINSFDKENYKVAHFPIWDVITENNIKFKELNLRTYIIKHHHAEWLKYLNSNNISFIDLDSSSKLYKKWVGLSDEDLSNQENNANLI
jgi:hypothetical protein